MAKNSPAGLRIASRLAVLAVAGGVVLHDNSRVVALQSEGPAEAMRRAQALLKADQPDQALALATRWFGSSVDATARQIAGSAHLARDEHALAQPLLERALEAHLRAGDHRQAAWDAQRLAGTLMYQEILGGALEAARLSVREADQTDDVRVIAFTRLGLGTIWAEIGDATQARTAYWEAQQRAARSPEILAWVYLQLGILQAEMGSQDDAVKLLTLALDVAAPLGLSIVVNAARANLARTERELGHLDAAEAHMSAVDPAKRTESSARFVAGLIAADRGDRAGADQLLALAAADPPTDDYAIDIAVQRGKLAERAGDVTAAQSFYREAIRILDKLRLENSLELRPWVLAHRREAHSALLATLVRAKRPQEALAIAEQLHARTWYDAVLRHAGPKDTAVRVASLSALAHDLHDAAPALTSRQLETLLAHREFLLFSDTESEIWRFYVIDGVIRELGPIPKQIATQVRQWSARLDDREVAMRLGETLVPAAAFRRTARPLYIVADGALATLPFAALRRGEQYLIENRTLVRLPGVVALRCHARKESTGARLLLGDSRDDLRFARAEVLQLAKELQGEAFVGQDVTLDRLNAGRNARLLHLGLHSDEDESGPSIRLSAGSASSADIVAMKLAPELAVLAGCATAVSRDVEGWDALSSAFLINGTRTVVATLQSVNDAEAAALFRAFYKHGGARFPAAALARAQRELLRTGSVSSWAPYAAYGGVDAADCDELDASDAQ